MILVDSGPLVAAANRNDRHHHLCARTLLEARPPRLVSGMVIAEGCYLPAREAGSKQEADFLLSFRTGFLTVADVTPDDLARAAELVRQYGDLSLGGTDASVIALAERLGITEIATIDLRHFRVVRPRHVEAFTLLPGQI